MRLQHLDFNDWLEHAFGREVRIQQVPWYFDPDSDWWDPSPAQALAYLTSLFENPEPLLEAFAHPQVAPGLTYLINTMASGDSGWFYSVEVPIDERIRAIEAIATFFHRLFKPRCTPHLWHLSEADAGPLNVVCYMWWDTFPAWLSPRTQFTRNARRRAKNNGANTPPRLACLPRERAPWAGPLVSRA